MLAVLAVGLDLTVLSVALPTLAGVLRASETGLQWFSSGHALALTAAMCRQVCSVTVTGGRR